MRNIFENGNSNNDPHKGTNNLNYIKWMNSILRRSEEIGKFVDDQLYDGNKILFVITFFNAITSTKEEEKQTFPGCTKLP